MACLQELLKCSHHIVNNKKENRLNCLHYDYQTDQLLNKTTYRLISSKIPVKYCSKSALLKFSTGILRLEVSKFKKIYINIMAWFCTTQMYTFLPYIMSSQFLDAISSLRTFSFIMEQVKVRCSMPSLFFQVIQAKAKPLALFH